MKILKSFGIVIFFAVLTFCVFSVHPVSAAIRLTASDITNNSVVLSASGLDAKKGVEFGIVELSSAFVRATTDAYGEAKTPTAFLGLAKNKDYHAFVRYYDPTNGKTGKILLELTFNTLNIDLYVQNLKYHSFSLKALHLNPKGEYAMSIQAVSGPGSGNFSKTVQIYADTNGEAEEVFDTGIAENTDYVVTLKEYDPLTGGYSINLIAPFVVTTSNITLATLVVSDITEDTVHLKSTGLIPNGDYIFGMAKDSSFDEKVTADGSGVAETTLFSLKSLTAYEATVVRYDPTTGALLKSGAPNVSFTTLKSTSTDTTVTPKNTTPDRLDKFIWNVNKLIINPLIRLLFALALLLFLYGVMEFIMNAENDEKRTIGKMHMLWGLVGLVIMFSVWMLLRLVLTTLNIKGIDPEQGTVELNDYEPKFPPDPQ